QPSNSTGLTASFTVTNEGNTSNTFSFMCSSTGPVSCTSVSPTSVSLAALRQAGVTVTYSVGAPSLGHPGSGTLTLAASGLNSSDQGYYNVTVTPPPGPVISLVPHNGDYRDVTKCAVQCFDMVTSYATPPYFSR